MKPTLERRPASPKRRQAHAVCDNSPLEASQFTVSRRDAGASGALAPYPPTIQPIFAFHEEAFEMIPDHINPLQWHQSLGIARQSCARVFRDGGTPAEALKAFGLSPADRADNDWSRAVETIAEYLCQQPLRRAA